MSKPRGVRRAPFIEQCGPIVDDEADAVRHAAAEWIDRLLADKALGPYIGEISVEATFRNGTTLKIGSRPFRSKKAREQP